LTVYFNVILDKLFCASFSSVHHPTRSVIFLPIQTGFTHPIEIISGKMFGKNWMLFHRSSCCFETQI